MTRRAIAVRPEPGLTQTFAAGRALGLEMDGEPLFEIDSCDWDCLDSARFDGLLIGSANALRHGGNNLARLKDLPIYAVGETTADLARGWGFHVVMTGEGGLQHMLDAVPAPPNGRVKLLRLAGEARVSLKLPAHIEIAERIVYRAEARPISAALQAHLQQAPVVLLHSAAAAAHLRSECQRCNIELGKITIAALGPRIADAAGDGWQSVISAAEPNDAALLALALNLCQKSG